MNASNQSLIGRVAAVAVLGTALCAQAPLHHIVTAESGTAPDGFRFVDPRTGVASDVTASQGFLGGARTVSVDELDPNGLYTSAGGSFGGAPLWRLELDQNQYDFSTIAGASVPTFGRLERMHHSSHGLLLTLSTVAPGLYWSADFATPVTQLTSLSGATDIAVIGDKVYVNTFASGSPSTIVEYDLSNASVRTLGSNYATVRSLGAVDGVLLAGLENGEVHSVDVVTNTMSLVMPIGSDPILAVATGETIGTVYVATAANEVFDLWNPGAPVYTSPHTIEDLDVSRVSQIFYGEGCAPGGNAPQMSHTGGARLGGQFLLEVTGAPGNSLAILALGETRANFDLTSVGFPGCTLLVNAVTTPSTYTDALGTAAIPVAIPGNSALVGYGIRGQFFVFGTGGVVSTNATEGFVR